MIIRHIPVHFPLTENNNVAIFTESSIFEIFVVRRVSGIKSILYKLTCIKETVHTIKKKVTLIIYISLLLKKD